MFLKKQIFLFPKVYFVRSRGGDATYKSVLTGLLLSRTACKAASRLCARDVNFASIERQGSSFRPYVSTFGVRADLYNYVVVVAFF